VRVVLGEDLTLLRDGLIRLLTAYDMEVVAAVDNGPELLRALMLHRPDVAVVDVRLPPTFTDEGLRAAIQARTRLPDLPVLVLSQHVEQLYARELLSAGTGGLGYLLKDRVSDVLGFIDAVRTVAGGGTAMDPEVVSQLLARHDRDERLGRLTAREREVLALMAEGHSNAGIAARLVITEKAVSKHIGSIFIKLDLYQAEDANRRVLPTPVPPVSPTIRQAPVILPENAFLGNRVRCHASRPPGREHFGRSGFIRHPLSGDEHGDTGVGAPADHVGQGDLRAGNLPGPGRAPQLPHEFDHLTQR